MKKTREISWAEFFKTLQALILTLPRNASIYGVPKGGMIVAGFMLRMNPSFQLEHDPEDADFIIDDILGTGATKDYYAVYYPHAHFKTVYQAPKDEWLVFPWEKDHPGEHTDTIDQNVIRQLQFIGEDPMREGLLDTPKRVIKSYSEIYAGYNQDPKDVFTVFESGGYDQIVLLKDFEIYSMCEHHMLPFFGKAHVAYIPNKKVIGISKLARLTDIFARRLQIQERIGRQVTDALMQYLDPIGAACIIEASHMCMRMRGVNKQNSTMVTSSITGAFKEKQDARAELMMLINKR